MKNVLVLFILLFFTTQIVSAQKVRLKKGICRVAGEAFLKYDCRWPHNEPCLYNSLDGNHRVLVTKAYPYKRPVPGQPQQTQNAWYYEIEFWDTEISMYTTDHIQLFLRKLYNFKLLNSDGTLNIDKVKDFVKINGEQKPEVISTF